MSMKKYVAADMQRGKNEKNINRLIGLVIKGLNKKIGNFAKNLD